jgi:uncharacterized membrane protein YphA (DoxX/SURF4 family)
MYIILRIIIGSIFILSGFGKLLSPYQNFQYVIQAYQLLPSMAESVTAQIFPWIELIVGAFVFLGLWTSWALRGALMLYGIFIVVVGQALIRGVSLENCGCFGELIHLKPQTVMVMDSVSLMLVMLLLRKLPYAKKFSLDSYFS